MTFDLQQLPEDLRPLAEAIAADARANPRRSIADLIRFSGADTYSQQCLFDALNANQEQQ